MALVLNIKSAFDGTGLTAATNSINKVDKKIGQVSRTFTKFIGLMGAGGAGYALVRFAKQSIEAYSKQEDAIAGLTQKMKNLGVYSQAALDDQLKFAAAIQQTTKYGDEQVIELQSLLSAYGLYGKQLKEATKATLNLSAGLGIDLKAATNLVGKAFKGNTDSLSRYGLIINNTVSEAEKFDEVLKVISETMGGMAEAEAKTLSGQMQQMKNRVGDLYERVGAWLIPVFKRWITVINGAVSALEKLDKWLSSGGSTTTATGKISALAGIEKQINDIRSDPNPDIKRLKLLQETKRRLMKEEADERERLENIKPTKSIGAVIDEEKEKERARQREAAEKIAADKERDAKKLAEKLADLEKDRVNAVLDYEKWAKSEQAEIYWQFFGEVERASLQGIVKTAESAEEVKRIHEAIAEDMARRYEQAGKTFSGGFMQAFQNSARDGMNWGAEMSTMISSTTNGMKSAFREFFTFSKDMMSNLKGLAQGIFQSILNSFLDMIAQMAAKAAMYGFLSMLFPQAFAPAGGFMGFMGFKGFAGGGYTGDGKKDDIAGLVHKGEFVIPADVVSAIKSGQGMGGGMKLAGASQVAITNNINVSGGMGGDVSGMLNAITEACKKGVRQANEMSNAVYKTGQKNSGKSVL